MIKVWFMILFSFYKLHLLFLFVRLIEANVVGLLTWEERYELMEELHAFVATLSLRSATLFQEP